MQYPLRRSERGAILIHVAVAILVLIGFLTFVVDYGVMWVGRGQAQNAADSGALAGAVAMAFDVNGWTDRAPTGPAKTSAHQIARSNGVWGEAPAVDIQTDINFTNDPADMCPAGAGGLTPCIRVDVYRNQAHGNPLPAVFGQAVGLTSQGVRATATARVAVADSSSCLKPWAIPDKWLDNYDEDPPIDGDWTDDDAFETVQPRGGKKGGGPFVPDVYIKPGRGTVGTGFTVAADRGRLVRLKQGGPSTSISPGVFQPVRIPSLTCPDPSGADCYRESIYKCNGLAISIGDTLQSENGDMIGPTKQGVEGGGSVPAGQALIEQDPDARWENGGVVDSCATTMPPTCAMSPRVVAIPVFDTAAYDNFVLSGTPGLPTFEIVNILGFFIDRMQGNDVVGYLLEAPGLSTTEDVPIDPESSFLRLIQLIR